MKILVTGAAGYLGSTLVPKLVELGHDVSAVDNMTYDNCITKCDLGVHVNCLDVTETSIQYIDLLHNADAVIHLAAIVGMPACKKNPALARAVNLDSVKYIVDNLRNDQILIFPNTNSGYGAVGEGLCTEETPLNAVSLYGQLKDEAEQVVLSHPNSTVFRLATVFGPSPRMRLDLLVNQLVYDALFLPKLSLFDGDKRRNYVHVKDVRDAFIFALDNLRAVTIGQFGMLPDMQQQVYNLGCDAANTTKQGLVDKIAEYVEFEQTWSEQTDPDKRDYNVSSQKLTDAGFTARRSLDFGIAELLGYYSTFPRTKFHREHFIRKMKNV